jgi:hypothetical protein
MALNLTRQVASNADNVRVSLIYSAFWSTSQLMSIGYLNSTVPDCSLAVRFTDIAIPTGGIITLAQLKVTDIDGQSLTVVNSRLRAEANVNPSAFSTQNNFLTRSWTTAPAVINWDSILAWLTNTEYPSPDIKALIQAVIGLPGWASGNPIVILWDDFEQRSTQTNNTLRKVFDYNDSQSFAAKLYIEYTLPAKRGWMSK